MNIMKMMNTQVMIAGMAAGMAMAMLEMIYELIWGIGFWSAPILISGFVLPSVQSLATPIGFLFLPVVIGLAAHMIFSMVLAVPFVRMVRTMDKMKRIFVGMGFGIIVFVVMWFAVLPLFNPAMLKLNVVVFAISHLVWGMALGMFATRGMTPTHTTQSHEAPAADLAASTEAKTPENHSE